MYHKVMIYNKTETCQITGEIIPEFAICYVDDSGKYITEKAYKEIEGSEIPDNR